MKIRTDFVTNSSSSSFMVNLTMEFQNGESIVYESEEWSGDDEIKSLSVRAKDAQGKPIFEKRMDIEEGYEFPYYAVLGDNEWNGWNLAEVLAKENVNELITGLERALTLLPFSEPEEDEEYLDEEDEEDEYEYSCPYDEETSMMILDYKNKVQDIADTIHNFMLRNLTSKDDIKEISFFTEFGGRGECLLAPDEIIEKIVGCENSGEVQDILEAEEDEETTLESLKELPCMQYMSEEAILEIIRFWNECDYAPDICNVGQELEDGAVRFSIAFENY